MKNYVCKLGRFPLKASLCDVTKGTDTPLWWVTPSPASTGAFGVYCSRKIMREVSLASQISTLTTLLHATFCSVQLIGPLFSSRQCYIIRRSCVVFICCMYTRDTRLQHCLATMMFMCLIIRPFEIHMNNSNTHTMLVSKDQSNNKSHSRKKRSLCVFRKHRRHPRWVNMTKCSLK